MRDPTHLNDMQNNVSSHGKPPEPIT